MSFLGRRLLDDPTSNAQENIERKEEERGNIVLHYYAKVMDRKVKERMKKDRKEGRKEER